MLPFAPYVLNDALHVLNAFLLVIVLVPLLAVAAKHLGLVDVPHGRKTHDAPVPQIGGLAMFAGFVLPLADLQPSLGPLGFDWWFLAGLLLLVAVGVLDDLFDLSCWTKLVAQAGAALIFIIPGWQVLDINDLIGGAAVAPFWAVAPFTLIFAVGIINTFNMIDGLDGLAGGAASVALFWLTVAAWISGRVELVGYILVLLFAVLGFLVFNMRTPWRSRAAVFMGDAGSMMLGAAIAFFIIDLAARDTRAVPLPVLLWLVALPIFDTLILIGRRIAERKNPLVGDRRHLHHLLLQAGLAPQRATAVLIGICAMLGAIGFAGWRAGISAPVMLAGLAVPFSIHLYFVCHGWKLAGVWQSRGHGLRAIEDETA